MLSLADGIAAAAAARESLQQVQGGTGEGGFRAHLGAVSAHHCSKSWVGQRPQDGNLLLNLLLQLAVEAGLESRALLKGRVFLSRRRQDIGLLRRAERDDAQQGAARDFVAILGRGSLNRAMHGDLAVVRQAATQLLEQAPPLGQGEEEAPPPADSDTGDLGASLAVGATLAADTGAGALEEASGVLDPEAAEELGVEALLRQMETSEGLAALGLPQGEVVGILQRSPRELVCCLDARDEASVRVRAGGSGPSSSSSSEAVLCVPIDRRLPRVRLRTRRVAALLGQRFVLRVDRWERNSRFPEGHLVRLLGPVGDLTAETEAVLVEAGAHWQPFCQGALDELPSVGPLGEWSPDPEEIRRRRDLRGPEYLVCSIDPPGCEDVDDALHARVLPDGRVEVGVHIADVSFFVREARARLFAAHSSGDKYRLYGGPSQSLPLPRRRCRARGWMGRRATGARPCTWSRSGGTCSLRS